MATTVLTPQIQFVTLAIGATAKQMGISATELYNRLNRHNLGNHGVGSPDHIQESDISMLYYLSHSHFI